MRRFIRGWLFALAALALSISVTAQGGNLLQNPSFETPGNFNVILNSTEEGTVFGVPPSWDGWVTTSPRTESWMNLVPDGYPHTGLFKFDGGRSLSISRGFATFTTAVFQRVAVPAGANVRGSARGFMERGTNPPPGAQFRVGIDPAGGTNPLNPGILWSPWVSSPNSWVQASIEATSTSTAVTLFLYSTQTSPSNPNAMYWDDAVLEIGGEGGTSASGTPGSADVVPTPAFAPFVAPQGAQPDGSIVHVVVSGDTLDAIAVAYGTTRDAILELNPDINRNFLMLGQRIMIRPPGSVQSPTPTDDPVTLTAAAATQIPAMTATQQATLVTIASATTAPTQPVFLATVTMSILGSTNTPRGVTVPQQATQVAPEIPLVEATATLAPTQSSLLITTSTPTTASATESTSVDATEAIAAAPTESNSTAEATATTEPSETLDVPPTEAATATLDTPATDIPAMDTPATDLPTAPVTAVAALPTIAPDVTALCVWMFDDGNQNRIQEANEANLIGGRIEIRQGDAVIETVTTADTTEPACFFDIAAGDYTAVAVAPDGYGLTTAAMLNVRVQENARTNVRFGAAQGVQTIIPPTEIPQLPTAVIAQPIDEQTESNSLLQLSGVLLIGLAGVVILGGIGLALFIRGR